MQLTSQKSLDFFFSSRILGKLFFHFLELETVDATPHCFLDKTLWSVDAVALLLKI